MLKEATAETRIRPIEEHPLVLGLTAEIERLKKAHFAQCEDHAKVVRERDQRSTAEKVSLQAALLATQDTGRVPGSALGDPSGSVSIAAASRVV
jgi:hypothetical protein